MFISYAQNFEDVVLWRVLGHVVDGTYVDVGAADPIEDSVTQSFYERGWSGLNVEPNHEFVGRLRATRPRDHVIQACAGNTKEAMIDLHVVRGTGLSTVRSDYAERINEDGQLVVETTRVPIRRLDDMLLSEGFGDRQIHFLKVDVEGAEESVLSSVDLQRWRPWIILVEATEPRSTVTSYTSWEPLLLKANYRFCLFDGLNRFYLADEHKDLEVALSAPVNFFDRPFRTFEEHRNLSELERVTESWHTLNDEYLSTLSAYQRLDAEHDRSMASYHQFEEVHAKTLESYRELEAVHKEALEGYQRLERIYEDALAAYLRQEKILEQLGGQQ